MPEKAMLADEREHLSEMWGTCAGTNVYSPISWY